MAIGILLISGIAIGAKLGEKITNNITPNSVTTIATGNQKVKQLTFNPPSMDHLPKGADGEEIHYGYQLVDSTNDLLPENVGNNLSCSSCHAGAGLNENVSPLVGVSSTFPQYRPREGKEFTIEDRINGCFLRSMNGQKLENDSKEMKAMVAYFDYISQGVPKNANRPWAKPNSIDNLPVPNINDGKELYGTSCISCHAADGSGTGANTGPALWGENSFNDGAGLGRLSKMAGFIQNNMPIGQENTLTDQQAADLAAYILSQERPVWKGHEGDWPKGGRPNDIITKEKREQMRNGNINWDEVLKVNP